ncbi:carboxylesterase [Holotrichia oblita]|uniref:Carboxylesterase n=1 Tax=Holotrichia oblita TaxID=644536 RepID=A0ACB9SY55_HOLOL|nr:carboxylesterase [Holotrichia oblita]
MLFLIVFRMIVIAITAASVTSERHSLEVEIENGWVRGDQITPSLFSWRGIPYAKPPLGKLRFEPPQKPDNWTGTWDASYDRSQCMQTVSDDIASVIFPRGDEDCLYINVYTPKIFAAKQLDAVFVYTPVIEHQHKGAVITGSYFNRLSSGNFPKIPVMIGYNSNEVLYFKLIMDLLTPFMVMYDFIPALLVPSSLRANKSDLVEIGTEIKNHYVGPFGSFAPSHFKQLRKFMNDNEFIRPIQQTARFLARYTRTYLYVFSYHHSGEDGAGHEAELSYLFNSEDNSYSDKYIKKCMTKLWTNFGIYGNPTPHNIEQCGNVVWKPIVPGDKLDYLRINLNVSMSTNPSKKDMKFWYKLFEKYANMPLNTY